MNIVFFAVPYTGHLEPNIFLFYELVQRNHRVVIYGDNGHIRSKCNDIIGDDSLKLVELPYYIKDAYRVENKWELDEFSAKEIYFSNVYREDIIINQQYNLMKLQYLFYSNYVASVDLSQVDLIFYDSYAYYCKKILSSFSKKIIEVNCAIWEPEYYFRMSSWNEYINKILKREIKNAPEIEQINAIQKKVMKRQKIYDLKNKDIIHVCYHSKKLQYELENITPDYRYMGYILKTQEKVQKEETLYISRGTMTNTYSFMVLLKIIEAVHGHLQVNVSLGNNIEAYVKMVKEHSYNHIHYHLYCNQIQMLQKSKIFITHGGVSGVREAIFCKTPMIIVPTNYQEYLVGKAIEKENAGILIGTRPIAPELIKSAISNIFIKYEEFYQGVEMLKDNLEVTWQQNGVINLCDELAL